MHHLIQIPRCVVLARRPISRPFLRPRSNYLNSTNHSSFSMNFIRKFFRTSTPEEEMSAASTKAQTIIKENAVAVFSKSYCPHCQASKKLLDDLGAKYFAIELDEVDDGAAIQSALKEISGQRTVPNIYIGGKHIGGNSDLQAKKGELKSLLQSVGAAA
ncbi:hypothetical protein RRF57_011370 [Xylaria bambusicola]|uniref:Glutaredoxin domain-containing protein n=1 Tax=Xylaria bambusicola TaxID=326684 RepID=A0AAN7UXZ5_9PEZI